MDSMIVLTVVILIVFLLAVDEKLLLKLHRGVRSAGKKLIDRLTK